MTEPRDLPDTPGEHDLEFKLNGQRLRLSLHLPARRPWPVLVIALHYGGTPHGYYGRGLLEQVVVPALAPCAALCAAPVTLEGDWTSPANCRMVPALAATLAAHYGVPRTLLVGYSMGAIGGWHLLATAPAFCSGMVLMAGRAPSAGVLDLPIPVHVLHGADDALFPVAEVVAQVDALAAAGKPISLRVLAGVDHYAVPAFTEALREAVEALLAAS